MFTIVGGTLLTLDSQLHLSARHMLTKQINSLHYRYLKGFKYFVGFYYIVSESCSTRNDLCVLNGDQKMIFGWQEKLVGTEWYIIILFISLYIFLENIFQPFSFYITLNKWKTALYIGQLLNWVNHFPKLTSKDKIKSDEIFFCTACSLLYSIRVYENICLNSFSFPI